ncbi:unnamed protein product [Hyaloperonospora brassicae]|uniref:RxLR effector candidate protein n=1 Tax=Hyaloperonospora brassicae TaxID=162125 RepID=A0AAV0UR89_HYABA|nr:unnamed protein product [Hyaloperonospora brassicae]
MLGVLMSLLLTLSIRDALALASQSDAVPARQLEPAAKDVQGASKGVLHPANSSHVGRVHEQKGEERALTHFENLFNELATTVKKIEPGSPPPRDELIKLFKKMANEETYLLSMGHLHDVSAAEARFILHSASIFKLAMDKGTRPIDMYKEVFFTEGHEAALAQMHLYRKFLHNQWHFLTLEHHWMVFNKEFWEAVDAVGMETVQWIFSTQKANVLRSNSEKL